MLAHSHTPVLSNKLGSTPSLSVYICVYRRYPPAPLFVRARVSDVALEIAQGSTTRCFLTLLTEEWQDAVTMSQERREQIEQFLIDVVEERDRSLELSRSVGILRWVLHQLSHLYRGVVQLRLFLYRKGIMRHHMLGCQVISVGNLTVGGTGKTPVVEAFARELTREGRSVAVLSRGYKKDEPPVAQRLWDRATLREKSLTF